MNRRSLSASESAENTRDAAINTILNDTRPKLVQLQRNVAASRSVEDLLPLAKSVRDIKAAVEVAIPLVPEVQPPVITQYADEDKLVTFKKTTTGALEYVALTMRALKDSLGVADDQMQILQLAKATSIINSSIPSFPSVQ